jgi:iron(III) transport system substrate-binding protein
MRSRGLLVVLVAAVLAGCGASPTSQAPSGGGGSSAAGPFAKYASLSGAERTQKLLADAKAEGQLDIYTSNTDIDDLVDGFKQAYPGIKINAFRANSETVLQRIQQEASARRTVNDIVDTDDFELDALNSQGVLANYDSPIRQGLRKEALFPGWTATRFNAFVVGWNTKLVPAGQEPKSFEDLADPKWKGKLAMELSDFDWYMALHTYLTTKKGMSDAQADDLFKRLVANAKVVKGHTVMGELLSAGQFSVALSIYSHTVDKAAHEDGAPVAFRPVVNPVILRPNGAALMRDAKHPAAALLWMDWVLTDGQKTIAKAFRIPAEQNVPGFTNPIPSGTETFDVPQDLLVKDSKRWSSAYDDLVRGAPKAQSG